MGISQTKRMQAIDNTLSLGSQLATTINTADDPCNIHGLQLDLFIGSNVGAEHNFGKWALVLQPRGSAAAPSINTTGINAEDNNAIFWMLGSWMIVDRGFAHVGGAPRTSRNCPEKATLKFLLENSALSTTAVRVHGTVTWFETTK